MSAQPTLEEIHAAIPGLGNLEYKDRGTFKLVYRFAGSNGPQALKLIEVPTSVGPGQDLESYVAELTGRVRRELDALKKCVGAALVRLGDIQLAEYSIAGRRYIAYSEEFLDGQSLIRVIQDANFGGATASQLAQLIIAGMGTIEALWHHGYIHRDIKPENVIATNDALRPYVFLDLGVAYSVIEPSLTTNKAEKWGTFPYMAPEVFHPTFRQFIDYKSDIYSLGVTAFIFASRRHPILEHANYEQGVALSMILMKKALPLVSLRSNLPLPLCRIIDGMLFKKQALRRGDIANMTAELKGYL